MSNRWCHLASTFLSHVDRKDSYVRMLFIEFISAFNTIIPQKLVGKLSLLDMSTSLCFLDPGYLLLIGPRLPAYAATPPSIIRLRTGAPQGWGLSPLLFTLVIHDCTPQHSSNHIINVADDTTMVGLISDNCESAYREEVRCLVERCQDNHPSLNVEKTKEIIVDFRKNPCTTTPLHINGSAVEMVSSVKFLGVHRADNLTWTPNRPLSPKKPSNISTSYGGWKRPAFPSYS